MYVWGDNIKSKFLAGDLVYGFRSDFCQFPFPGCYPGDYAGIAEKMQKGETREIPRNLTIKNFSSNTQFSLNPANLSPSILDTTK